MLFSGTTYKYLYFFIISFYCLILSQYGMETWDTGYISSFSWRIINGQNVYEDFLYKFPPVTIYLHAFFMKILPEVGQFFYFRIIAYLSYGLQVYLFVSGIYLLYDIKKINKWAIMIVCFMISWMNFSPYPWPTTDGIFFASIAFWMVSKYKNSNFIQLFCIALFCFLSALSKQSFYLIPILFLIWINFKYNVKTAIVFLINIILLLSAFTLTITSITSWQKFANQLNGELRLQDLYSVGFHNYVFLPIKWLIPLIIVCAASLYFFLKKTNKKIVDLLQYLNELSFLLVIVSIFCLFINKSWLASFVAFDAGAVALIYAFTIKKKSISHLFPLCVLLAISWSVSISLGYPAPLLFGTGIILTLITLMENEVSFNPKYYFFLGLPLCVIAFASNRNPYREASIVDLDYSMETISPKLKFIKTKKETFNKHLELKNLIDKYGENYIVAPNMPMTNYLFNDQSELPTDWLIDTEVNRQTKKIIAICAEKKNYIFIEKSFVTGEDYGKYTLEVSSMAWFIYKKFNKIAETKYFIIYNQLKANEKLP